MFPWSAASMDCLWVQPYGVLPQFRLILADWLFAATLKAVHGGKCPDLWPADGYLGCSRRGWTAYPWMIILNRMDEVTRILGKIEAGDPQAPDQLLPLVYHELRKLAATRMASERPDHTLQPTALVHEAYTRLVDPKQAQQWNSRGHFFAAAAEAMRRILVDHARNARRLKRGGAARQESLTSIEVTWNRQNGDLLDVHSALEKLEELDPQSAQLVKLRYFLGLTQSEAADLMNISRSTADRRWAFARAWLYDALK